MAAETESRSGANLDGRLFAREADAHAALGLLLRRRRTAGAEGRIRTIVGSSLTTLEKLRAVHQVDAVERESATEASPPGGARKGGTQQSVPFPVSPARLKSSAKRPQTRAGICRYVWFEYWRIAEFGRKTHTLDLTLLSPRLRADKWLPSRIAPSLEEWATELLTPLTLVLEQGWKVLSRREYNLVVVFAKLCQFIAAANLKRLKLDREDPIDRIRTLEAAFFLCHSAKGSAERIVECVEQVLSMQKRIDRKQVQRTGILMKRILYRDYELPSLCNFLLFLNMLRYRRYLTLDSLIAPRIGELVPANEYVCSEAVREKMAEYVEELKGSLHRLDESRAAARMIRAHLRIDAAGEIDFTELLKLCELGLEDEASKAQLYDRENILFIVLRFLNLFDATFAPLLTGRTPISGGTRVVVFAPIFFGSDFENLRTIEASLRRLFFGLRTLSHQRYLAIRRRRTGFLEAELDAVREIEEALRVFFGIANRLSRLLSRSGDVPARLSPPLEPAMLHATEVILPQGDRIIRAPRSALDGKSIREAVAYTVTICYLIVAYLNGQDLLYSVLQEVAISKRFESALCELHRLVDEQSYDEFLSMLRTAGKTDSTSRDSHLEENRPESLRRA